MFVLKYFLNTAFPSKFLKKEITFNSPFLGQGMMSDEQGMMSDEHGVGTELRLPEPLMEELKKGSCFCGYHIYLSIWDAESGEPVHAFCLRILYCSNECNHYAVAIVKDGMVVGNLHKTVSRICSLFVCTGDTTTRQMEELHVHMLSIG